MFIAWLRVNTLAKDIFENSQAYKISCLKVVQKWKLIRYRISSLASVRRL